MRFVFELEARAVVMENVPESTNFGGKNIPEIVCTELTKKVIRHIGQYLILPTMVFHR